MKEEKRTNYSMFSLLEHAHTLNADFFVDGEAVCPETALRKVVQEEGAYMADYVFGEGGRLEQVRLDRIGP